MNQFLIKEKKPTIKTNPRLSEHTVIHYDQKDVNVDYNNADVT